MSEYSSKMSRTYDCFSLNYNNIKTKTECPQNPMFKSVYKYIYKKKNQKNRDYEYYNKYIFRRCSYLSVEHFFGSF